VVCSTIQKEKTLEVLNIKIDICILYNVSLWPSISVSGEDLSWF
jgi:hypothetical protein